MRRWIFRVVVGLVAVLLLGLLVRSYLPNPVQVDAAKVTRGQLLSTLEQTAKTRVAERYAVTAPITGALVRISLRAGDPVSEGTKLADLLPAELDPRSRADAQARAEAANDAAREAQTRASLGESALAHARSELSRIRTLHGGGAATPQQLESAQFEVQRATRELASARLAVQVARHQLDSARAIVQPAGGRGRVGSVTVTSPVNGVVLRVLLPDAGPVAAGTPLLELGDLNTLEVVAEVQTRDAVTLKPGMKVLFDQWGGGKPLHGEVRVVEPSAFTRVSPLGVEEQRVNVVVGFVEPPEQRAGLSDGFELQARFILWEGSDVLQVPASAVFRRQDGWAVFVIEEGSAKERAVKIGHRNPSAVELLEGVAEGAEVILHPGDAITDGVSVERR